MLETARLFTIIGPGGVGKTRLAAAVAARRAVPSIFVDLTRVRAPALVPESIPDQLGLVDARADPLAATIEYALSGPMLLLVIDNVGGAKSPRSWAPPPVSSCWRRAGSRCASTVQSCSPSSPLTVPYEGSGVAASASSPRRPSVSATSSSGPGLVGAAERALERIGGRIYPDDTPAHERVVAGLIDALGPEEYGRWYAAGATLTFDQSVDLALG